MRTALYNVVSDPKLVVLMIVLSQVVAHRFGDRLTPVGDCTSGCGPLCIRGSRAPWQSLLKSALVVCCGS